MKPGTYNLADPSIQHVVLVRVFEQSVTIATNAGGKRVDIELTLDQAQCLKEVLG